MKLIMGNFSGCYVFMISYKYLKSNYNRFYTKYWRFLNTFLSNNDIHTHLWLVAKPPKSDLVL